MTEKRRKPKQKPTATQQGKRETVLARILGFEPMAEIAASERKSPESITQRMKLELAAVALPPGEFETLRQIETLRLDRYRRALDPIAMRGDPQAVRACIDATKAVLAWAQAGQAVKHEHSGPGGGPIPLADVAKMTEGELRDFVARCRGEPGAAVR